MTRAHTQNKPVFLRGTPGAPTVSYSGTRRRPSRHPIGPGAYPRDLRRTALISQGPKEAAAPRKHGEKKGGNYLFCKNKIITTVTGYRTRS